MTLEPRNAQATRILVVDDEQDIRNAIKALLSRASIPALEVVTCASAEEALGILKAARFDLVVSDHRMGKMSGTDFLEEARARFPTTGRVMITGFNEEDIAIEAINRAQVHAYIKKPWTAETFVQTVRRVLADLRRAQAFETALARGFIAAVRRPGPPQAVPSTLAEPERKAKA